MQKRTKILAVDDNPTNIAVMEEILGEGHVLATAACGEEALVKARDFLPDLILLDVMMPGINGYEVCRQLRTDPRLRHTKIIMVSAKAMVSERLKGYEAGADDYITKPFEEEELLAKVRVYLRLKTVEEVDQLKTDVLSLLGHETRTPLNGILAPAQMLMSEEPMADAERQSLAQMIHESGVRLHSFLEKIMLLSALKAGKSSLRFERTDLRAVIQEAVERIGGQATAGKVTVTLAPGEPAWLAVDRLQMRAVIVSLLDNAIRFSPSGGQVTAAVVRERDQIVLHVRDEGAGIAPEFLARVFDDFADTDVRHHTEGHGLSLAIAQRIAWEHGGRIQVSSRPGVETIFSVSLPVTRAEDSVCEEQSVAVGGA